MTDDEHHHDADEDQGEVDLPPPGLARPQVSVSAQQREIVITVLGCLPCYVMNYDESNPENSS